MVEAKVLMDQGDYQDLYSGLFNVLIRLKSLENSDQLPNHQRLDIEWSRGRIKQMLKTLEADNTSSDREDK